MITFPLSNWYIHHNLCPEISDIDRRIVDLKKLGYNIELEYKTVPTRRPGVNFVDRFARHVVVFDDSQSEAAALFKLTHL
jgi:hypothetical protein